MIHAEALYNQLREMVAILAAPAEEQISYLLATHSAPVDELYQQLDESIPSWFPRLRRHGLVNEEIEGSLVRLDDALEKMMDLDDPDLWEDGALSDRQEWKHIREIAGSTLALIGPPKEIPPGPPVL